MPESPSGVPEMLLRWLLPHGIGRDTKAGGEFHFHIMLQSLSLSVSLSAGLPNCLVLLEDNPGRHWETCESM